MACRWARQWDVEAIVSLKPVIVRCTHKQIKAVFSHVGRITDSMSSACWRNFLAMARELDPTALRFTTSRPLAAGQMTTIEWDPRLGEDHG